MTWSRAVRSRPSRNYAIAARTCWWSAPRCLTDAAGNIVQPYAVHDPASIGVQRRYHVEFWPIGNRFRQGHRLRLYLVGVSAYHLPAGLAIDSVAVGGVGGSRLLVPVLPGNAFAVATQ